MVGSSIRYGEPIPARSGMRVEVIYSGRASVHHSRETKASRAAQFCS